MRVCHLSPEGLLFPLTMPQCSMRLWACVSVFVSVFVHLYGWGRRVFVYIDTCVSLCASRQVTTFCATFFVTFLCGGGSS